MFTVLDCVLVQHEHFTVLLAASVALVGMLAFFNLLLRTEESAARRRRGWIAVSALAAGLSVWATHFLAMLAYQGLLPIGFDFAYTALSAIIAVTGFWVSLSFGGDGWRSALFRAVAVTLTVAAMHFTGMSGMQVAADIRYDVEPILWGTLVALALFFLSFWLFQLLSGVWRILGPAVCAIVAICALHFTAMSATELLPDPMRIGPNVEGFDRFWLKMAISGVTFLVLAASAVAALIDRYLVDLSGFANATLDGIAMVREGRILEANARFASLVMSSETALVGQDPNMLLAVADGRSACAARPAATEASPRVGDKSRIFELAVHTIEYRGRPTEVIAIRDLTEKRTAQRKVEYLARHDMLTGLVNRTLFHERLEQQLAASAPTSESFALLALDLDRFKAVNDLFGHAEGDRVLKDVAGILKDSAGPADVVARLGGDEFMILMAGTGDAEAARQLAEGILARFAKEMDCAVDPTAVGVSIGIAVYPKDGADGDTLMHAADIALYRAKIGGRGMFAFYDLVMDQETRERRQMEAELRQAVGRGEMRLVYQPILSTGGGEIVGYEALIRWRHPQRGDVPPDVFIPAAEETGVIISLGEWVLREACIAASRWEPHLKIAVNISPVQFRLANLAFVVSRTLNETGLRPSRLELEMTETALLKDRTVTLDTLRQLKALGVSIVMDDFGTGYSSLSNLQSFPFDKIKIDRSFIAAMDRDENARAIVRAVVGLGRSLALPVTAEGIETDQQYRMVVDEGCTQAQGYLFGRPDVDPVEAVPTVVSSDG